jgi:hypothetical protein
MIHAMGWLIKLTLFSIFVLILGNWIHWNGKTVSDQVKTQIAHAERSDFAGTIRRWTNNVAQDARKGARKGAQQQRHAAAVVETAAVEDSEAHSEAKPRAEKPMEKIPASERQKLRALIQELNTTRSADGRSN